MTPEQLQKNRDDAAALVRAQLKLSSNRTEWTNEQRQQFNKVLAAYIKANPDLFASVDLNNATVVESKTYTPLEDASFDFSDFTAELGSNVAAPFQAIGDGVISAAKLAKYAIPVLAIAAFILLVYMANDKAGKPVKLPGAS